MARRKITREFYESMLAAFREVPGNFSHVATAAGTTRKTAKRAYELGWPSHDLPPIKDTLEEEKLALRARMKQRAEAAEAEEDRQVEVKRASNDALETREREAMMVRAARENVVGFMKATNDLLHGGVILAGMIRENLEEMSKAGQRPPLKTSVYLMNAIGGALRQGNEAATLALRMERLLAGEPESILGVKDMSIAQVAKEVEAANRAMTRASKRGLVVLPGGKSKAG